MIFLVQFEIVSTCTFFQRLQIALALRARAILVVFEKIYCCLFISNCTRNHVITYTNLSCRYNHQLRRKYVKKSSSDLCKLVV